MIGIFFVAHAGVLIWNLAEQHTLDTQSTSSVLPPNTPEKGLKPGLCCPASFSVQIQIHSTIIRMVLYLIPLLLRENIWNHIQLLSSGLSLCSIIETCFSCDFSSSSNLWMTLGTQKFAEETKPDWENLIDFWLVKQEESITCPYFHADFDHWV